MSAPGTPSKPVTPHGSAPEDKQSGNAIGCLVVVAVLLLPLIAGGLLSVWQEERGGSGSSPDFEDGVFSVTDADRLVRRLDAAAGAQGVCYGWRIDTGRGLSGSPLPTLPEQPELPVAPSPEPPTSPESPDSSASPQAVAPSTDPWSSTTFALPAVAGVDYGSNLGRFTDPQQVGSRCPKWVVFNAVYDWDIIDEVHTLRSFGVESNLPDPPSGADFREAGITAETLKRGDAPARLADAVAMMPMIMSGKSGAAPVPQVTAATAPAPGDTVQRDFPTALLVGGLMVAGGLLWILIAFVRSRRRYTDITTEAHPHVR